MNKNNYNSRIGKLAEDLAVNFLINQNLIIIQKNFRCIFGEIDLICQTQQQELIFVEVRYRKSNYYGTAIQSIGSNKRKKIINSAYYYLNQQQYTDLNYRFDVITIEGSIIEPNINWFIGVFTQDEIN